MTPDPTYLPRWRKRLAAVLVGLAVVMLAFSLPLTWAWLTNIGPVYAWHLAGPALVLASYATAYEATKVAKLDDDEMEAES